MLFCPGAVWRIVIWRIVWPACIDEWITPVHEVRAQPSGAGTPGQTVDPVGKPVAPLTEQAITVPVGKIEHSLRGHEGGEQQDEGHADCGAARVSFTGGCCRERLIRHGLYF